MISMIVICAIFAISLFVTIQFGWTWTYVAVYLPTLILLNQMPEIPVPHIPIAAQNGPLYAILIGMPFRGERFRFKICSIDIVFVLLLISATITAWSTEVFETGVNTFRTDLLELVMPYFVARVVFQDWHMRRATLKILIGLIALISVCALIEVRLYPYFYQHMLQSLGLGNKLDTMAYSRYGFFRVSGPVEHPIYFGNTCLVLLGMVAVLARTSGISLKNGLVATTLFACFGCIITSISFTPYVGCIVAVVALLVMMASPLVRNMIFPLTTVAALGLFAYTMVAAKTPLGDKPDDQLGGSMWTRHKIISESWIKAEGAGPFGYGIRPHFPDDADFNLKSIDNSYMQFTISRGWVYTSLWVSLGIFFAWRAGAAFRRITDRSQIFPLAAAAATVLALMVSMYTVWAGALYTVVWAIMLGLSNTLIDTVLDAAKQPRAVLAPVGTVRPIPYPVNPVSGSLGSSPAY